MTRLAGIRSARPSLLPLVEKVTVSPNNIEAWLRANGIEALALELRPARVRGGCRMRLTRINRTGEPQTVPASDGRLTTTVRVPIKRRSGRKLVTLPGDEIAGLRLWDREPTPLQMALARGHRWLAMLESGEAGKEGVHSSYMRRMVNLTTLAPNIVAAILDETLSPDVTLFEIAVDPPALWEEQRVRIAMPL